MARLTTDEKLARTVICSDCGAQPGQRCVYIDGAFRGTPKLSGAHASRVFAAKDKEAS